MKFRGHGNGVAIAIATVALVAAGTGTAVAVSSTVNIVDPTDPSRVARVDTAGRLTTVGATSTLAVATNVSTPAGGYSTILVSPTAAQIAITGLTVVNPRVNASASNANYSVYLERQTVDANGFCTRSSVRILATFLVSPGDAQSAPLATPLLVKPDGTAKYCLALYGTTSNAAADTGPYFAFANFTGYVAVGRYVGTGSSEPGAPAAPTPAPNQKKTLR